MFYQQNPALRISSDMRSYINEARGVFIKFLLKQVKRKKRNKKLKTLNFLSKKLSKIARNVESNYGIRHIQIEIRIAGPDGDHMTGVTLPDGTLIIFLDPQINLISLEDIAPSAASFSSVISHEVTHIFDPKVRAYDEGQPFPWLRELVPNQILLLLEGMGSYWVMPHEQDAFMNQYADLMVNQTFNILQAEGLNENQILQSIRLRILNPPLPADPESPLEYWRDNEPWIWRRFLRTLYAYYDALLEDLGSD